MTETPHVRILWTVIGRDDAHADQLVHITKGGATILRAEGPGDGAPGVGDEIRFDLLAGGASTLASGLAKVTAIGADDRIEIAFVALGVEPRVLAALGVAEEAKAAPARGGPPPLPPPSAPAHGPPPLPAVAPAPKPAAPAPAAKTFEGGASPKLAPSATARVVRSDDDGDVEAELEQLTVKKPGVIIGIDLGTTYTCACYVDDGRPRIIPSRTGTTTIPSMITFDPDGSWYVGQRAADRQIMYPMRTVYGSKRLVGRSYRAELASELQQHFAYPLAEADGLRFGVRIDDRVISMDTIAARVLDEVRTTSEAHLGRPVEAAVITVPAYFSEVQRDAVRRAAREANLVVHRIVNEPTAAAVAYGHKQPGTRARVAVWDFGGGTFDFSVVDVSDGQLEVLATGGDNFVGGSDFDDMLAGHLLAEFQRKEGVELDADAQQIARLREAAEVAKRQLSSETEHRVELPEFTRDPRRALVVDVTRETFDAITRPLIERTLAIATEVLASRGLGPKDIDDVLLVGGTTRIPAVQRAVTELFGRKPSKRINPDEAVAIGAALLADEIGSANAPALLDILPMTIGYGALGNRFLPIVARHTRLPAAQSIELDADLLGNVTLPLFQGESLDVAGNEYLCSVIVEDRSLWDKGRVTLRVSFDEHCVMAIEASNAKTKKALPARLDRTRSIDDVLRDLGHYEGPPAKPRWQPPPTFLGKALGRLAKIFRR
jgi:molecular chaperone DnaK